MGKEVAFKFIQDIASKVKPRSAKFLAKQAKDIELFGEKKVSRVGVSDDMLQAFTPFRRLSRKPCSLSDPKYFIEQYEKVTYKYKLPQNWEKMSEAEKVDFIVKDRYSKLIANKIMNGIKNEPTEHHFSLAHDGEILTHDFGELTEVKCANDKLYIGINWGNDKRTIDVHNHPLESIWDRGWSHFPEGAGREEVMEYITSHNIPKPKFFGPFSPGDMEGYVKEGITGYVVDSSGHKFCFIPREKSYDGGKTLKRIFEQNAERPALYEEFNKFADEYCTYVGTPNFNKEIAEQMREKTIIAMVKSHINSFLGEHRKNFLESDIISNYFGKYEQL